MSPLHVIGTFRPCDMFHYISVDVESFFFFIQSIRLYEPTHHLSPSLSFSLQSGSSWVLLFPLPFMLAQGIASPWPESTALPAKQEEHTALWWTQETKHKPETWGSRLRRMITGDLSLCTNPFQNMESFLQDCVNVQRKFMCQQHLMDICQDKPDSL